MSKADYSGRSDQNNPVLLPLIDAKSPVSETK